MFEWYGRGNFCRKYSLHINEGTLLGVKEGDRLGTSLVKIHKHLARWNWVHFNWVTLYCFKITSQAWARYFTTFFTFAFVRSLLRWFIPCPWRCPCFSLISSRDTRTYAWSQLTQAVAYVRQIYVAWQNAWFALECPSSKAKNSALSVKSSLFWLVSKYDEFVVLL